MSDPVFRAASTATTNTGGANSSITGNLPSTTVGDINVLCLTVSSNNVTTADPGIPTINGSSIATAGWNLIDSSVDTAAANTPRTTWVWRIVQAGDAAITWAWTGSVGNAAAGGVAYQAGTFNATTPFPAPGHSMQAQVPTSTSFATPSVTTTVTGLLLSVFGCRTTGTWTAPTGDTKRLDAYSSAAANFALCEAPSAVVAGTYSKTGTFSASTSVGNQGIALLASTAGLSTSSTLTATATLAAAGVVATSSGASLAITATLAASGNPVGSSSVTATATITAAGVVARSTTAALTVSATITAAGVVGSPARTWISTRAGGTQYVAHRDGLWGTYGEETLEGYTAAATYNTGLALEISVFDTSDGVWVCSHDSTTGRVFSGTNQTINSVTWATLSPGGAFVPAGRPTTLVGGNVMRRIEEVLDAFPSRIFVIDNKHNLNHASLLTVLEAHAPGRYIAKQANTGFAWLNAAAANGAACWMYFYPNTAPNLSSALSTGLTNLSTAVGDGVPIIFGLGDYSTSGATLPVQTDANTFFSFTAANALYSWAHILDAAAQKTSADGQASTAGVAFDGYMISNVSNVIATNTGTAALTATATITAAGVVGKASGATLNPAAALTAGGVGGLGSSAALTATSAIAASGGVAAATGAAVATTATITAAGVVARATTAALTGTASLTAAGGVATGSAASLTGTAATTATGTVAASSGAALALSATISAAGSVGATGSGSATLAGSATITAGGTVAASGGTTSTITTTITASGVVATASGGTLAAAVGVTAAGAVATSTGAALASAASTTAAGVVASTTTASLTVSATITAAGTVGASSSATLPTTAAISAAGLVAAAASATVTGTATITAAGTVVAAGQGATTVAVTVTITAVGAVAGAVTPPDRTFTVTAETRSSAVAAESRVLAVLPESRALAVQSESRTYTVPDGA